MENLALTFLLLLFYYELKLNEKYLNLKLETQIFSIQRTFKKNEKT